jgi:serine protease Do
MRSTLLAVLAAVAIVGVAEAQKGGPAPAQSRFPPKETAAEVAPPDWRAEPRYDTLNLQVGFEPDPREVAVDAGGSRDASTFNPECAGWIDFSRPDVDLNYAPGQGQYPLYISAVSQADTTIVINDPQGNWHCNDDLEGLNPGVVFQTPLHGNYNIWVGTLDRGPTQPATVRISEIPPRR